MKQTKIDSLFESITNIIIRAPINMAANTVIFPALGYEISLCQNFTFMMFFTVVSVLVSYGIRRLFNGKSVYRSIIKKDNKI
jgi:hypothetical protein